MNPAAFDSCPVSFINLARLMHDPPCLLCEEVARDLPPDAPAAVREGFRTLRVGMLLREQIEGLKTALVDDVVAKFPACFEDRKLRDRVQELRRLCGDDAVAKKDLEGAVRIAVEVLPDLVDEQVARLAPLQFPSLEKLRGFLLTALLGKIGSRLLQRELNKVCREYRRNSSMIEPELAKRAKHYGFDGRGTESVIEARKQELLLGLHPASEEVGAILEVYFDLLRGIGKKHRPRHEGLPEEGITHDGRLRFKRHNFDQEKPAADDRSTAGPRPAGWSLAPSVDRTALLTLLPALGAWVNSPRSTRAAASTLFYVAYWADGQQTPAHRVSTLITDTNEKSHLQSVREDWLRVRFGGSPTTGQLVSFIESRLKDMPSDPPVPDQLAVWLTIDTELGRDDPGNPVYTLMIRAFAAWKKQLRACKLDPANDPIAMILKAGGKTRGGRARRNEA